MRGEEQRAPLIDHVFAEEVENVEACNGIESRCRFVENEQFGSVSEGEGKLEFDRLAAREAANLDRRRDVQALQELVVVALVPGRVEGGEGACGGLRRPFLGQGESVEDDTDALVALSGGRTEHADASRVRCD
ncbi:Uncharacterised protein [Chlamydia trachomatis]|nr:Uncharacterised protein [Chlamydia trachomatis]